MSPQKNIVILDAYTANPGDLSWSKFEALGTLTIYDRTPAETIVERAKEAHILLTNKCVIDAAVMAQLPALEYIGLLATGMNNIDLEAAKRHQITVRNAVGYSTSAVAQHVFSLILHLTNHVAAHHTAVQVGAWTTAPDWTFSLQPLWELKGKTLGVYGLGAIGQAVSKIALAFDMRVIATRKNQAKGAPSGVELVTEAELLAESDFLTLHAPLTAVNTHFIQKKTLQNMKPSAVLINTGRGALVQEADLKWALESGLIAAAALDVLSEEPPPKSHLLLGVKNCILTPHIAWAAQGSRGRLLDIVFENIVAYLERTARDASI